METWGFIFTFVKTNRLGLKNVNKKISREDIYNKIDDVQIFSYYFGEFKFRKSYSSVFRKDSTPSTGFYINKAGKVIYNDITTREKLDAFAFVAKKYGLSYGEAIIKVGCDFGVIPCENPPVVKAKDFDLARRYEEELKKETIISIEYDKWTHEALNYWKQYTITEKELEDNDVYNVAKLRINNRYINNYGGNLRFAYALEHKNKLHYKIYQPEGSPEYKWITNIPLHVNFGYNKLKYESDTLIITKSVKELILFRRYFPEVISLQNESQASLRDVTLNFLKKKYKYIYLFFDGDETGVKNAKEYEKRGIIPIYLPEKIITSDLKDSADLVKKYGIKQFERFLKINELI